MKLLKKIFGFCIVCFFVFSFGYGKYDCDLADKVLSERGRLVNASQNLESLTQESVLRAIKNLKSYCTQEGWSANDKYTVDNYSSSPFLFDHLIDVGFRRLDGNSELSYVEVDQDGKNWFEERKKIATDIEGKKPSDVYKKFINTWGAPNNYKERLYEKYTNVCYDIKKISNSLFGVKQNTEFVEENNNIHNCYRMVRNRYQREIQHINMIMLEQGGESIENSLKKLANKDISQNGLMRVLDKFNQFQGYFRVVVNKVQEGTKTCSY